MLMYVDVLELAECFFFIKENEIIYETSGPLSFRFINLRIKLRTNLF